MPQTAYSRLAVIALWLVAALPGAAQHACKDSAHAWERPWCVLASDPHQALENALPHWLRLSGEYRARAEGYTAQDFTPGNDSGHLPSRLHLELTLHPESNWSAVVGMSDARVFYKAGGLSTNYEDTTALWLAYAQLGRPGSSLLAVRAGRQELALGAQRLIGTDDWDNVSRSFDGLHATLHTTVLNADLFAAAVVVPRVMGMDRAIAGNDLYGAYITSARLPLPHDWGEVHVEPYWLWRTAPASLDPELTAFPGAHLNERTGGLRISNRQSSGWQFGLEAARQWGTVNSSALATSMDHERIGYGWSTPLRPELEVEHNFASGGAESGKVVTFDPLYPSPHDQYGQVDALGLRNLDQIRTRLILHPWQRLQLSAEGAQDWVANALDGVYGPLGQLVIAPPSGGANSRKLGWELDGAVSLRFTRWLKLEGGFGHLFCGPYLKQTSPGNGYDEGYVQWVYAF